MNRLPSPVTQNKSPLQILYHQVPGYTFLKTFGCVCWPHLCPYNTHKIDFHSTKCIFIGYSLNHKGYKCFDPSSKCTYIAGNVVFDESSFPYASPHLTAPSSPKSTLFISLPPIFTHTAPNNSPNPPIISQPTSPPSIIPSNPSGTSPNSPHVSPIPISTNHSTQVFTHKNNFII